MKHSQKKAIVLQLIKSLSDHKSWCGETHIQKAAYCLEKVTKVPIEFEFILYKHGPFSFDLRDELTVMRADGLLDIKDNPYPFGPSLTVTRAGEKILDRFPKTLGEYGEKIEFISEFLGEKGVVELERLTTALYVSTFETTEDRAVRVNALKPHISIEKAHSAVSEIDKMISSAVFN